MDRAGTYRTAKAELNGRLYKRLDTSRLERSFSRVLFGAALAGYVEASEENHRPDDAPRFAENAPDYTVETVFGAPYDEQVDYWNSKGYHVNPGPWYDTAVDTHTRAFSVANVGSLDILKTIRTELDRAQSDGITYKDFAASLAPKLAKAGWWAEKGEKAWTTTDEGEDRKRLQPWRLKLIYNQNLATAYQVGRYKQMSELFDFRPYLQYMAVLDLATRPDHAAKNGMVKPYDDPFWNNWYPPNGWNCRCSVRSLTAKDLENKGLIPDAGRYTNGGIDDGWDYHVGKRGLTAWQPEYPEAAVPIVKKKKKKAEKTARAEAEPLRKGTVKWLKAELDAKGIPYKAKMKKAELEAMLYGKPEAEPEPEPDDVFGVDDDVFGAPEPKAEMFPAPEPAPEPIRESKPPRPVADTKWPLPTREEFDEDFGLSEDVPDYDWWIENVRMRPRDIAKRMLDNTGMEVEKYALPGSKERENINMNWDAKKKAFWIEAFFHPEGAPSSGDSSYFTREIHFADGYATHEVFELAASDQGRGLGKTVLKNSARLYQDIGIKTIKLQANIDVGGYAWARYGFVPTREVQNPFGKNWDDLRGDRAQSLKKNRRWASVSAEDKKKLLKILDDDDPKAIWALADSDIAHKRGPDKGLKVGKELLLGTSWEGELNLDDPEQSTRFWLYIDPESKEARSGEADDAETDGGAD